MLKKLLANTAIYGLAPYLPRLIGIFILPIITPYLTADDYGVYGTVSAYVASVIVLQYLGLQIVIINSYYHFADRFQWIWRQLFGFLYIWFMVYALFLGTLIYCIIPEQAEGNTWEIILIMTVPLFMFGPTSHFGMTWYQLKQTPIPIAIRTVVLGIISLLLNLYFIAYMELGYMGWFYSEAIIGLLMNISYVYPLYKKMNIYPVFRFKWSRIKYSLRISLPTIPHYYSYYLLNVSDRVVLDTLGVSTAKIGLYNVAGNFGNYFHQLSTATGVAIEPMLNECYQQKKYVQARALNFILQGLFIIGTVIFCLWIKEIFKLLIRNDELNGVYPLAIIIIMGYNYRPMYLAAIQRIIYAQKTQVLWKVTFMAGMLNIIANFSLVPFFGFEVVAYTTFVSLMFMGYAGFFLKEHKELQNLNYHQWKWLAATCIATVAVYFAVELTWQYKVPITIFLSGFALIMLRLINKNRATEDQ